MNLTTALAERDAECLALRDAVTMLMRSPGQLTEYHEKAMSKAAAALALGYPVKESPHA